MQGTHRGARPATAVVAAVVALVFSLLAAVVLTPPARASASNPPVDEWDFLNLINRDRRDHGLAPLAMVTGARDVARNWSAVMAGDGQLRHNPDVVPQLSARYPDWLRVGENVGVGSSVAELHPLFMGSAGHRRNILGDWGHVGVGVRWAGSRLWVTVNFLKSSTPLAFFTRTPVTRVAGASDSDTAVLVSRRRPASSAAAVVVARVDGFADALAGGPLAAVNGGTVLLTPSSAVPRNVVDEAVRVLAPGGTVYLLGGPAALAPAVDAQFAERGLRVTRIAGPDRFATAALVAGRVAPAPAEVFVVSGVQFPDAVVAGAAAAARRAPILLVLPGAVPGATDAYLRGHARAARVVIGGPVAISNAVAAAVGAGSRVAGTDRFGTAVAVADTWFRAANRVVITSGAKFTDALAASPEAARDGAPIVLTTSPVPDATYDYVAGQVTRWAHGLVVGGPADVTDAAVVTLFS